MDEVVMLDVTRGGDSRFLEKAQEVLDKCFAPVTLGGGIRKPEDVRKYFAAGADKITVNTGAVRDPGLITTLAKKWGNQSVVLSMDVRDDEVVVDCGREPTGMKPLDWVRQAEDLGAGEIMVTAMDRDGTLTGYDLELCSSVANEVSVPVMFHAGAGSWKHFHEGIDAGASAVCTQNIYHFTETSLRSAKSYLQERGVPIRR